MKKLRSLFPLLFLGCLFLLSRHFKPDTFFSNLGLAVPQSEIASHQTGSWLADTEDHLLILDISSTQWPQVLSQFKAACLRCSGKPAPKDPLQHWLAGMSYSDVTPNLKTYYRDFVAGYESFFPGRPPRATAGEFSALGREGNEYRCRFLREETTGRVWFVGRMLPPR